MSVTTDSRTLPGELLRVSERVLYPITTRSLNCPGPPSPLLLLMAYFCTQTQGRRHMQAGGSPAMIAAFYAKHSTLYYSSGSLPEATVGSHKHPHQSCAARSPPKPCQQGYAPAAIIRARSTQSCTQYLVKHCAALLYDHGQPARNTSRRRRPYAFFVEESVNTARLRRASSVYFAVVNISKMVTQCHTPLEEAASR